MTNKFDRFSKQARQVLTYAQEEAQLMNHSYIGTEHLLLGLVRNQTGIPAKVLQDIGVDLQKTRERVEQMVGKPPKRGPYGHVSLMPRTKRVIELAVDEARGMGHQYIGPEHLLLGLMREKEGLAADVLQTMGVSLETLRNLTLQQINTTPIPAAEPVKTHLALISALIPAHNEAGNLTPLMDKIARTFSANQLRGEVVLIDDGSTDGTRAEADALAARYPFLRVVVVHHRRNRGLTEALKTGFRTVKGDTIIFLPADLESNPEEDIPKLLGKMAEGYDVVAGWRQGRKGRKLVASSLYNFISRHLFGVDAHDMNWIKAFTREVMLDLHLRSDWHRFILMIAAAHGYKVGEVEVSFYPRQRGKSKFGFWRIPVSFLDALVVKFILTFSKKPMLFFGAAGTLFILVGTVILIYLAYLFFAFETQQRPVFIFALFLVVSGLLLFLVGFLAELIVTQAERLEEF